MTLEDKLAALRGIIEKTGGAVVAFSGGVDSTLLAKVAHDVLGERVLAVTLKSQIHPAFEQGDAVELARLIGIRHKVVDVDALAVEGLAENPPDRCYICKRQVLGGILAIAREEGLPAVVEGSNASDEGDFRPGMRAVRELGVLSPLKEAGLTKDEIREISCRLGLPTWSKPSFACLASRIPYGQRITPEKLRQVDTAEDFLRSRGYQAFRVRHHGDIARIELAPDEMKRFLANEDLSAVAAHLKSLGFAYVTLDLQGYRTGSLNEVIDAAKRH